MPTENRRITFNSDELLEALVNYDKHADQKFTCGVIVSKEIFEQPMISIVLDVKVYGQSKNLNVVVDARYVGAALVMYCLNNSVPVPTQAVRYLKISGENLSLCFSINEAIDGPATMLPEFFDFGASVCEVEAA